MQGLGLASCCAVLCCSALPLFADYSPQDIVVPNGYGFAMTTYYAEPAATNATIAVRWSRGGPSVCCGHVGFGTADGTAIADQDYTPVSGTLYFSSPAWSTFEVPLHPTFSAVDKTVWLLLTCLEPRCGLFPAQATLIIRGTRPKLSLRAVGDQIVRLSWPTAYTNYVVERTGDPAPDPANWTPLEVTPDQINGDFVLELPADQASGFFRLRQK